MTPAVKAHQPRSLAEPDVYVHAQAIMGTTVSLQIVGNGSSQRARRERKQRADRAIGWFTHIEAVCTRFDPNSELRRLCLRVATPVAVSELLFEALQYALTVAEASNGAFDPVMGTRMEQSGFDREHRSGVSARANIASPADVSYRDVHIDQEARTVTLRRALLLDLGAIAKGLAIDLAARTLAPCANFAINAGGDVYVGGHNVDGAAWSVGIRHPRDAASILESLTVSDVAVCTSGDYERPGHILHPQRGEPASALVSATVVAPSAMAADAMATAAFVLGPTEGVQFLTRHHVQGLLVTPALERFTTPNWQGRSKIERDASGAHA